MKKVLNYVLLAIVTGVVLYLSLKDNYQEIIKNLCNMDIKWLLIAFLCILMYWFFKSLPLFFFTRSHKKDYQYKSALNLIMRTQFANAVTPFATGGQPYQIYYLNKEGIRPSTSTGIILQNFIVYQIALVFLGLVALISNYIFHYFPRNDLLTRLITLGFIINTLVIVVSFAISFSKGFNKKMVNFAINILAKLKIVKDKQAKLDKWNDSINNFHESAKVLIRNKKLFFSMILINLIALCFLYVIPMFVLFAFGNFNSINIFTAIISSAYVMLIGSFVPIPGGTGGLEYGFIKFYGNFIKGGLLSATMLMWRFITYYFGLVVGAIAFNIKGRKKK